MLQDATKFCNKRKFKTAWKKLARDEKVPAFKLTANRIRPKKKFKSDRVSDVAIEEAVQLIEKMAEAFSKDRELNQTRKPALSKFFLLPFVRAKLCRREIAMAFL